MLKAPLDILADKLRGYVGLAFDLMEIPEKVLAACQALMPHLELHRAHRRRPAATTAHPHLDAPRLRAVHLARHFETIYWPTLKPIVEALWAQGNQVLFYAEGKWDAHLDAFAELPAGSIVYHIDRGDSATAAPRARPQILPERRRAQRAARLRHARSREGALPEADRTRRRRGRLHHGRRAPSCRTTPRSRTCAP